MTNCLTTTATAAQLFLFAPAGTTPTFDSAKALAAPYLTVPGPHRNWRSVYLEWVKQSSLLGLLESLPDVDTLDYISWDVFRHFGCNIALELQNLYNMSSPAQFRQFRQRYLAADLTMRRVLLEELGVNLSYDLHLCAFDLLVSYRLSTPLWQTFPGLLPYLANSNAFEIHACLIYVTNALLQTRASAAQQQLQISLVQEIVRAAILEQLILQNFALPHSVPLSVEILAERGMNRNITTFTVHGLSENAYLTKTLQLSLPACYVVNITTLRENCHAYWAVLRYNWFVQNTQLRPGWVKIVNEPDPVIVQQMMKLPIGQELTI